MTEGAQPDGLQLSALIENSKKNGVKVKEIVGDMAYVSDDNLAECEKEEVTLYAKINTAAASAELEEGFSYSKDAHMLQCPTGHLAMQVDKRKAENRNTCASYCFSVKSVKNVLCGINARLENPKRHTYNITQPNAMHQARLEFENSEALKKKREVRHRIEQKNGEMKTAHGFRRADSVGLIAMRLQAYLTAIVVNMKRIVAVMPAC